MHSQWRLRLIISTGNWTRQTLEEALILLGGSNLSDQDLKSHDEFGSQACADLRRLGKCLLVAEALRFRALNALRLAARIPIADSTSVERWIARAIKVSDRIGPRFFDNRGASLLAQLPVLVREHAHDSARNYLGMGSGFYRIVGH